MTDTFFKYKFRCQCLYVGERTKKGTFRPSISPIGQKYKTGGRTSRVMPLPYSTVTGSIKAVLGYEINLHGIGKITGCTKAYMSVAPNDAAIGTSKLPITVEYLTNVRGELYIRKTEDFPSADFLTSELILGGMKSKGFGTCVVMPGEEIQPKIIERPGRLLSRIFLDDEIMGQFGIMRRNIAKPYFGYLFRRTSEFDGYYQKSLFEGSIIRNGYDFLVEVAE
jgi:hypothetical protein